MVGSREWSANVEYVYEPKLSRTRGSAGCVTCWLRSSIDRVCINQEDLQERSKQVQFVMDEVYRDAEEVIVWLGEESEDSGLALDFVEAWSNWNHHESGDGEDMPPGEEFMLAFDATAGDALDRLFQRPYWTRLWVFQEVVLAQKVQVICGRRRVLFESFVNAHSAWGQLWPALITDSTASEKVGFLIKRYKLALAKIIDNRQQYRRSINDPLKCTLPFLDLLISCQHLKATDPRDKIYGLLGLGGPYGNYGGLVRPDYLKPVDSMYCEIARALIEDDQSLRAISFASSLTKIDQTLNLPSWVPDWRSQQSVVRLFNYDQTSAKKNLGVVDVKEFVRFSTDSRIIWVPGVASDKVSILWPPGFPYYGENKEQFVPNLLKFNLPNGFPALQAFFRTMSFDLDFISGGSLTPIRRNFFIQATAFLEDLSKNLSTGGHVDAETDFDGLVALFVGQPKSKLALEWPSDLEKDLKLYSGRLKTFTTRTKVNIKDRVLFQSANGLMGLGPPGTKMCDDICVLMGYPAPFILRKVESHYLVIGECFVLGLMESETLKEKLKSPQVLEIH